MAAPDKDREPMRSSCGESGKETSPLSFTNEERAVLRRKAAADMKQHGFTTPEELIDYYDSKRGY